MRSCTENDPERDHARHGYFTPRQMLVDATALTVAAAAILLLVALPWWRILGAIPAGS